MKELPLAFCEQYAAKKPKSLQCNGKKPRKKRPKRVNKSLWLPTRNALFISETWKLLFWCSGKRQNCNQFCALFPSFFQEAYTFWTCSTHLPMWLLDPDTNKSVQVEACRSTCLMVEKRCPFLVKGTEDDMASGNPSFICKGESSIRY